MREFVYLSDNKLRQFVDDAPRRTWWPGGGKVSLSLPFGGLQVEKVQSTGSAPAPLGRRLEAVTSHIDVVARWFEEEELSPGEWVAFELPLMYALSEPLVLFLDPPNQLRATRLLLHGSASSVRADLWHEARDSDATLPRRMSEPSFVYELEQVFESLDFIRKPLTTAPDRPIGTEARLERSIARVIDALDSNWSSLTAASMQGLARVSVSIPDASGLLAHVEEDMPKRVVVASPLYVERTPPGGPWLSKEKVL